MEIQHDRQAGAISIVEGNFGGEAGHRECCRDCGFACQSRGALTAPHRHSRDNPKCRSLDLLTRTVSRDGRWIGLVPREYRLLEYMMRHQGQVVTRAMLFREVWNYKFVPESNLVDVHMGRLRRKIDRPDETPMIYSIRGRGFVLQAPV